MSASLKADDQTYDVIAVAVIVAVDAPVIVAALVNGNDTVALIDTAKVRTGVEPVWTAHRSLIVGRREQPGRWVTF